jgi:hypothetical protein
LGTDECLKAVAHDRHDRAVVLDVEVDITVVVDDVEQPLEIVGRDITLLDQQRARVGRLGRLSRPGVATVHRAVSGIYADWAALRVNVHYGWACGVIEAVGGHVRFSH